MSSQDNSIEEIGRQLNSLESRLARLESILLNIDVKNINIPGEQVRSIASLPASEQLNEEEKDFESRFGRFGLAWMGNIILLFGIAFLTQYLLNIGQRTLSVILGYVASVSIYYLADYLKKSNHIMSFIFKMNALVILYYMTLRLHFFSLSPILPGKAISIILLCLIVVLQVYLSIRDKSQSFAALSVVFVMATAMFSETTHFMLILVSLASAGAAYLYYRYKWEPLLIFTIVLSYIAFFLWLVGNPLMGHPMKLVPDHNYCIIYLFAVGAIYSAVLLLRKRDGSDDLFLTGLTVVNGIFFTLLLTCVVLGFFSKNYVTLFTIITLCCLLYSTVLHSGSDWNFASAYYALYGFMTMSIALYGLFGLPRIYLVLPVQSLIVVSMALWFRNRLIIVMNSMLFLTMLFAYLITSKSINGANFSFALVSLISARIINWKRSRLQIKTDLIRNLYLFTSFFMVLYALYHALPGHLITISWTLTALIYFLLSLILKNVKYRYMALGTMICAAFYLFIIDLAKIELIYRVLALLFLAAISIGISIYYTNRIKKTDI